MYVVKCTHGTNLTKARANIADCGRSADKPNCRVLFDHRDDHSRKQHEHNIKEEKAEHLSLYIVLQGYFVYFYWQYRFWVEELGHLTFEEFKGEEYPSHLNTATGRSSTPTNKHHDKDEDLGRNNPQGKISLRKACGRDNRNDLKKTVS